MSPPSSIWPTVSCLVDPQHLRNTFCNWQVISGFQSSLGMLTIQDWRDGYEKQKHFIVIIHVGHFLKAQMKFNPFLPLCSIPFFIQKKAVSIPSAWNSWVVNLIIEFLDGKSFKANLQQKLLVLYVSRGGNCRRFCYA